MHTYFVCPPSHPPGAEGRGKTSEAGWERTPVGKLPPQVLAREGHDDHGQQELDLLEALLPLLLRVAGALAGLGAQQVAGYRGQGVEVLVVAL